jgi:hypothetical protein
MKLFFMQFFPASYYFLSLRPKYSLQQPVPKPLTLCSYLNVKDQFYTLQSLGFQI